MKRTMSWRRWCGLCASKPEAGDFEELSKRKDLMDWAVQWFQVSVSYLT